MPEVVAHIPHMASLAALPDLEVAVGDSSVKAMWWSADTDMTVMSITYKITDHFPPSGGEIWYFAVALSI